MNQALPNVDAGGPYTAGIGEPVSFEGTASDISGEIALYEWDFESDGTYDWSSGTTGSTTHAYADAGEYSAVLRVTDDDGNVDTDATIVDIVPAGVSGTVTTTTWTAASSPYHVVGEVLVPAGETLTIEPGVDVLFDADAEPIVEGEMQAIGTESDSIRFIRGAAAQWGGLRISGGDSSTIAYARVSDGHPDLDGGGIQVAGVSTALRVERSVISGNVAGRHAGGIVARASASLYLLNSNVRGNHADVSSGGVLVSSGANATIEYCVFARNTTVATGSALFTDLANSVSRVPNCTIVDNSGGIAGIVTGTGGTTYLSNSIIWGNSPDESNSSEGSPPHLLLQHPRFCLPRHWKHQRRSPVR